MSYDVVIMSDLRLPGGTTSSNIHEAIASARAGYKVGLVHAGNYRNNPERPINPRVRDVVNDGEADLLVYGESIKTDLLIIRFPLVLSDLNSHLPKIDARDIRVIVNQPPQRTWGDDALLYDVDRCHRNVIDRFGIVPKWHPIGPTAREGFDAVSKIVELERDDWVNLIDVDQWFRGEYKPRREVPVIGRHSRDHWSKWPDNKDMILGAYPDDDSVEVRVLGGAESPIRELGYCPGNWRVWEFGGRDPAEFLRELDVYVYITHSQYLEAFGRSIFEALATGVPVVLPPQFRETFGGSVSYAEPHEVQQAVIDLVRDKALYSDSVESGLDFVRQNYGFSIHAERLSRIVGPPTNTDSQSVISVG